MTVCCMLVYVCCSGVVYCDVCRYTVLHRVVLCCCLFCSCMRLCDVGDCGVISYDIVLCCRLLEIRAYCDIVV